MAPSKKSKSTDSQLTQLSKHTIVVADTGEVQAIQQYQPRDATTNPSLILKAALLPEYSSLVEDAIQYANGHADLSFEDKRELAMDKLSVNFGAEITKIVSGYVSTEVDARLSFDVEGTIKRAHRIIDMYKQLGIDKSRILIKIASTYEGIRAAEQLQKDGITCNLTLLFSLVQAAACAEAGITLISPFVGRILDWHKAKSGKEFPGASDPGVISVSSIYGYFKRHGFKTIVMGASFRSKEEVLSLAGCDRLTIAPALLKELQESFEEVSVVLSEEKASDLYPCPERVKVDEASFRWAMNEDPMATEKLAEGIRNFAADIVKLEKVVGEKLSASK